MVDAHPDPLGAATLQGTLDGLGDEGLHVCLDAGRGTPYRTPRSAPRSGCRFHATWTGEPSARGGAATVARARCRGRRRAAVDAQSAGRVRVSPRRGGGPFAWRVGWSSPPRQTGWRTTSPTPRSSPAIDVIALANSPGRAAASRLCLRPLYLQGLAGATDTSLTVATGPRAP
ncbi:hypothetical protein [Streptomyces sp. NPDC052225]|uniref:hypothetical protein n=1 Tax=Streptomyces sp. NPDC052225 TaxID=3154949 RepID=UPI00343E43AD